MRRTVRVLIVTPRYPPDRCGVGDYTALLARHLARRGVDVTVMTAPEPGLRAAHADGDGVTVRRLVASWGWTSLPLLCAVAAQGRFDVVHVQYQNEMYGRSAAIAALPAALRLLRPRLPVVVTVHDYGTPWPRRLRVRAIAGPYGKAWFAVMLWASRRVVLTNEQDERRFTRQRLRYTVPASRYAVVPVGSNLPPVADAACAEAAAQDLGASDGEAASTRSAGVQPTPDHVPGPARSRRSLEQGQRPGTDEAITLGYFGFVNPAKGVDTLVEAFRLARRRRPSLRLLLVCALRSDEPYHETIRRLIEEPELRDAVTVTGELPDAEAASALSRCDVVALPFREGVSLRRTTLAAALALGRAVISTRSEAPPAALREGQDLLLVPPADAQALADAIVALADDPARRAELGRHARAAAEQFAWPSIAERIEGVYRGVLA